MTRSKREQKHVAKRKAPAKIKGTGSNKEDLIRRLDGRMSDIEKIRDIKHNDIFSKVLSTVEDWPTKKVVEA